MLAAHIKNKRLQSEKTPMKLAFSAAKRLVKIGVKCVVKDSGHFRALFPKERATVNFTRNFTTFSMATSTRVVSREISRQHFCKPCRDDS